MTSVNWIGRPTPGILTQLIAPVQAAVPAQGAARVNTYNVVSIATGLVVYTYQAPAPVAWVGMDFANFNHVLVTPPTPVAPPPTWLITALAFRLRFTIAEQAAIYAAAVTDHTVAAFMGGLDSLIAAKVAINLADTTSVEYTAVNYLASTSVITAARANAVLTTPAAGNELP